MKKQIWKIMLVSIMTLVLFSALCVMASAEVIYTPLESFEYSISGTELTITKYIGSDAAVNIASTYKIGDVDYTVTAISGYTSGRAYGAFENKSAITDVTLPYSVEQVGNETYVGTFAGCSALVSVTVKGNPTYAKKSIGYTYNDTLGHYVISNPTVTLKGWTGDSAVVSHTQEYAENNGLSFVGLEDVRLLGFQPSADLTQETLALRFVGAIDSLDYRAVGFVVMENNNGKSWETCSQNVYSALNTTVSNGTTLKAGVSASNLGVAYLTAVVVKNIPNGNGLSFTVVPYVVNQIGATVYCGNAGMLSYDGAKFGFINKNAHRVTFVDCDGTVLKQEIVADGANATAPTAPAREGYTFIGWDKTFTGVKGSLTATAQYLNNTSSTYEWDHVVMGCYGFVDGMAIHPADPDIMYVWTDVGGMYRWDPDNEKWIQLMDVLGYEYTDFKSISGVALDPNDLDVLYVACGDNDNLNNLKSDILKSTDRGNTWTQINFASKVGLSKVRCYNTTIARAVGDPLVIDPNNSNIMYFGTMENGFYRSTDKGATWTKITSIPDTGAIKGGVVNVYVNPAKVSGGVSTDVYVSFWGKGIYKSTDGGLTFALMDGSPLVPSQVQVVTNGSSEKLYASSYHTGCPSLKLLETLPREELGSFYKYENGTWTSLRPSQSEDVLSFSSFLIDSRNPNVIILNTAPWNERYNSLFRSTDGGATFKRILTEARQASRLIQDPLNPNNLWMPCGGSVSYLYDFATFVPAHTYDKEPYLVQRDTGVETLCVTEIVSLPGEQDAPILLQLMQDHSLRVQEDLHVQAPDNAVTPKFHHGGGIDFCEGDPSFVVRVGTNGGHNTGTGTAAYSTDSGRSFTAMTWDTTMRLVDCAVGAEKQDNGFPIIMVFSVGRSNDAPDGAGVYRTLDGGASWEYLSNLPTPGTRYIASHQYNNRLLASDRVNPNVFYYVGDTTNGIVYRTMDGGTTWEELTVSISGVAAKLYGRPAIKCVPDKAGHVWVLGANGVVYTSSDYGATWSTLSGISALNSHCISFGFGIGKDPEGDPAVYVVGYVNGVLGCYLSDDMGQNWTKINPDSQKFFAGVVDVAGDRRVYGRVFMSTGGNGTLYAQIKP